MSFSRKKFQSLEPQHQHKKAAELLRKCYISKTQFSDYECLSSYMNLSVPSNQEERSDRYHYHLQKAQTSLKEHNLLPKITQGDKSEGSPPLPIAIFLDKIRSAHNIGSILRTTEALALGSVHFSSGMAGPDNKKVTDSAMGTENWVSFQENSTLDTLPRPIIVLETCEDAPSIFDFKFPKTFTLVIGNEEYGCSQDSLDCADVILNIPMYGKKNSLNVANAFAMTAGEIRRQLLTNKTEEIHS